MPFQAGAPFLPTIMTEGTMDKAVVSMPSRAGASFLQGENICQH